MRRVTVTAATGAVFLIAGDAGQPQLTTSLGPAELES
jgi:hypothetical protein